MSKKIILVMCVIALVFSAGACSVSTAKLSEQTTEDNVQDAQKPTITDEAFKPSEPIEEDNEEGEVEQENLALQFKPIEPFTNEDLKQIDQLITDFVYYASEMDVENLGNLFSQCEEVDGYDAKYVAERIRVSIDDLDPPTYESRFLEIDRYVTRFFFEFFYEDEDIAEDIENNTLTNEDVLNIIYTADYSTLCIKRIDCPVEWLHGTEAYEYLKLEYARSYGFQNMDYRACLLELDEKTFYCGFTLYKYNDNWMIHSLDCIGYIPTPRVIEAVTEDEYVELISH